MAALHTEDGDANFTARAWIKAYSKDAQGQVTADFPEEGSVRQEAVLHFAESHRTQEITVRINNETRGVVLDSPDPAANHREIASGTRMTCSTPRRP
ncbi:hypothetical protein [Streptomyces microflavus]|uniref:hypothetical protein n=1 Tax=Streptomyces microflavus TaxID=1919 RepID=UPI0033D06DDC